MAEAYYEPTPATDSTFAPVPGATFQVFELADKGVWANPLSLRVGAGNPSTTVDVTAPLGTLPGVHVTSPNFKHIWKSGTFEWERHSIDGAEKAIEDAKIAASNSASDAALSKQAAEQAASLVDAPADTVMRDVAANPASAFAGQLSATIADSRIDTVDGVFAALDYRANRPLVLALCSDSTADQDNEWYELALKDSFATLWPDRAVDLKRWNKSASNFYATVAWQDGIFPATEQVIDPAAVLYADTFNRTGNAIGSEPDVGNPYTGTGTHPYTTDGSKLVLSGATGQFLIAPSIPAETPDFKYSADLSWAYATSSFSSAEIMVGKDLSNYLRLHVEGTASASATLRKMIGGTLTTIATFANPVFTGTLSTQPVSLELSGTTVTAKIAGETVTATLSSAEVTALTAATREVRYRTSATNFALDNAELTGQKTTQASAPINPGLPKVTVYNGGAAGETTEYHRTRIAAMYPEQPDIMFINHGHNYATASTAQQVFDAFQAFLDALFAVHDPCPVVVTSQNPEFGTGKEAAHKAWMLALREYAQQQGWGYVPLYEAFMILPDGGASEVPDGVHPGIGTGRVRQANTAKAWIAERSKRAI